MVCLSGGKATRYLTCSSRWGSQREYHSIWLLWIVIKRSQGFRSSSCQITWPRKRFPFFVIKHDTYSTVKCVVPEGKTSCGLCFRLCLGTLNGFTEANGVSKIALRHHRDDIVETLFLNLFFGTKMKTMPPKLISDDGRYVVIRPLAYFKESDLAQFAEDQN